MRSLIAHTITVTTTLAVLPLYALIAFVMIVLWAHEECERDIKPSGYMDL